MSRLQQNFFGISAEHKMKLHILSSVMQLPKVRLAELMIDNLWEQKQDMVTSITQQKVNKAAHKILKRMVPKL